MSKQLQLRGGTETEHNSFTGANRELTVDTTNKTLKLHDGTTVGGVRVGGTLTIEPIITISQSVNEGSTTQGSYTSSTGSDVTITCINGTITNHNTSAKTFDFIAADVTTGADEVDTISAYATKAGELKSETDTAAMVIVYVPVEADDAYVDNLSEDDSELNDGFEVI